jgi:hypothetical protein
MSCSIVSIDDLLCARGASAFGGDLRFCEPKAHLPSARGGQAGGDLRLGFACCSRQQGRKFSAPTFNIQHSTFSLSLLASWLLSGAETQCSLLKTESQLFSIPYELSTKKHEVITNLESTFSAS